MTNTASILKWLFLAFIVTAGVVLASGQNQAVVAPLTVAVPAYSASYQPGQQTPDQSRIDALEARLRRIEDRLDELLRVLKDEPPETLPGQVKQDPLRSAASVCAGCHHADRYEKNGGGFQLFNANGTFAKLSNRAKDRVVRMVVEGQMPPPESKKTLTEEQRAAIVAAFQRPVEGPPRPELIKPPQPEGEKK